MIYIKIENGLPTQTSWNNPIEVEDRQVLYFDGKFHTLEDDLIPDDFDGDSWDASKWDGATRWVETEKASDFWVKLDANFQNLPVIASSDYPDKWFRWSNVGGYSSVSLSKTINLKYADLAELQKKEELIGQKLAKYKALQEELKALGHKI